MQKINLTDPKRQFLLAIAYFLLAGFCGIILRFFPVIQINHDYKFILHTHSHIALLGWIYLGISTLLYHIYLKKPSVEKTYSRLLVLTHISLIGMLITFPIQGYALFSIIFSTFFLFCSYWFTFLFIKRTPNEKKGISYRFAVAGLIFLVISSIGPWALGAIISISGPESVWYRIAIYFYLHFLYNGAFIGLIISLFIHFLESKGLIQNTKHGKRHLLVWTVSVVLTFFLSILFAFENVFIYLLAGVGNLTQLLLMLLIVKIGKRFTLKNSFNKSQQWLFKLLIFSLIVKILLQTLSNFPYFVELTKHYPDFIIAYLHLVFLGILSTALFLFGSIQLSLRLHKIPVILFMFGFLLSEVLIVYRGMNFWLTLPLFQEINLFIVVFSSLMIAGTAGILYFNRK